MEEKHKSYGYEGGYEDWTADKVFKNMKISVGGTEVADVEETEEVGDVSGSEDDRQDTGDFEHDEQDDEDW